VLLVIACACVAHCHCYDVVIMVLSLLFFLLYLLPAPCKPDAHCILNNVCGSNTDQSHPHIAIHRRLLSECHLWHYAVKHPSAPRTSPSRWHMSGTSRGGGWRTLTQTMWCAPVSLARWRPDTLRCTKCMSGVGCGPARVAAMTGTGCISPWNWATIFRKAVTAQGTSSHATPSS
jgi:hypothetical protein